jgi:4-amino-4-deoxy-L-arabinose transferase-like glycosyltransferase
MAAHEPALQRSAWRVLLAICAWLAATAWLRPLMLPDEGRYVGVAHEMLVSGDWLTPTLNGLPFLHKPPLFYWITASSLAILGDHEFAARVAPLVGGAALAFSLFLFARRWMGARVARAALLVALTQPLVFIGSQFANLDMLVAGCIACTVLLLAHVALCLEAGQPAGHALPSAYVAAALGVLAKGLIGAVLPALVIATWLLATRRWRDLPKFWSWTGFFAFVLIALPWFLAMQSLHPGFAHYFFIVQHFQRFTEGGFNNLQPWWFYPAVLCGLGLPWSLWLLRTRLAGPDRPGSQVHRIRVLLWLWLGLVLLFFSLPQSKLVGYVLPALPPLCLLIATAAPPRRSAWWAGSAMAAAALCVGIVLVFSFHAPKTWEPLADALNERHAEGEPVIYVGDLFYDVAFYAGMEALPVVVEEWGSADIARHDDWRKELADGAAFAPASAAALLLTPQQMPTFLCGHAVAWVFATDAAVPHQDWLRGAKLVRQWHGAGLWRIDTAHAQAAGALPCTGQAEAWLG